MGTNAQVMDWMMDTYLNIASSADRQALRRVVTGKSLIVGGSEGREKATGQGVVHCIVHWAKYNKIDLKGLKIAIQGFGNVGSHTAKLLAPYGCKLVAVGDHGGYFANPEGFDAEELSAHVKSNGSLKGSAGKSISKAEFFATECDVIVPAALELQIGVEEAQSLKAKCVVEAANGPTDLEGDRVLKERGIHVIPDILANSGGVVVSYYEWLQNKRSEDWDLEEVDQKLEKRMYRTLDKAYERQKQLGETMRTTCYAMALERLRNSYSARGIWP